jgi:hypothetical protein
LRVSPFTEKNTTFYKIWDFFSGVQEDEIKPLTSLLNIYVGDQINKKIGIGLHPGQGRFPKGSLEAKEHMARLRAMRRR